MAYTIISQNNTTTTLSDENGNVITVPARVTLATSTDYTIIKVNNNSVDLESGDGKIIRGVPACVVLAGEGGGGGGSVDYSKTVQRAETMPTADSSNAGQQFLYSGESDATYTHGYIYENVKSATYTGTVSFEAATLSGTTVTCSGADFANFLTEAGADPTPIVSGTMTFEADANGWRLVGKDSNDNTVTTFIEYVEDYEDAGFTFTGTPQDNDVIAFTCTVEEASATYTWTRIDVQPAPSGLPDQTGQSGKFLYTDGTDASWSDKPLVNNTPNSTPKSVAIGNGADADNANTISYYAANIAVGPNAKAGTRNYSGGGCIAIGDSAQAGASGTMPTFCIAIGGSSSAGSSAVVFGYNSVGGNYSTAVGGSGLNASYGSVVLGYNGTDSFESGVLVVSLSQQVSYQPQTYTYKLLDYDGTIPTDRYATTPTADGTYVPTLTISSGVATRTWGSGGGGGSYTAGAGIDITNDVISTKIPMVTVTTNSTAPTVTAKADGTGLIAIGQGAQAGSANYGDNCVAIGEGARATGTFSGYNAVAIGGGSYAGGDGVAIGASTHSGNLCGVAIGYGVRAGNGGIIIGGDISASATGTNSGFDIVLYDPATFTSTMYNVIKNGGEINPDRLGTGYDPSKTQTLKNVQGVLTWVDD